MIGFVRKLTPEQKMRKFFKSKSGWIPLGQVSNIWKGLRVRAVEAYH